MALLDFVKKCHNEIWETCLSKCDDKPFTIYTVPVTSGLVKMIVSGIEKIHVKCFATSIQFLGYNIYLRIRRISLIFIDKVKMTVDVKNILNHNTPKEGEMKVKNYIKDPHTAIFNGPTGCGKIRLVLDLIEKEYNKHYCYIIIVYHTLRWNKTYHAKGWIRHDDKCLAYRT